ncbi:MAG: DUF72 domain-containing protein [Deltaproteobacteria bacterium]|nr:DUF72 domain-containing protein [Deltaproteobacteria bacterium]
MLFRGHVFAKYKELLEARPNNVSFGTTSWIYEGWKGIVYFKNYKNKTSFRQSALVEYFLCPLFDFVEVDFTYYDYPTADTLKRLDQQIPTDKRVVFKVTRTITRPEEKFLNDIEFKDKFLKNFPDTLIGKVLFFHLQFSHMNYSLIDFSEKLQNFLKSNLPYFSNFSIEFRNREFLNLFESFLGLGATPCLNHWSYMPGITDQISEINLNKFDKIYVRLLTPLGISYEKAVEMFKPYDRVKLPQERAKSDLAGYITTRPHVKYFVAVNNRFEGCAPLTIADILKKTNVVFRAGKDCSENTEP